MTVSRSRGLSRAAVVAAGIVLLLVAAWAASRADVDGTARPDPIGSPVGEGLRNDVALVVLGGIGMLVALAAIPLLLSRHDRVPRTRARPGRHVNWRHVALTLALGFAVIYGMLLLTSDDGDAPEPPPAPPPEEPEPVEPAEQPGAQGWAAVALLASGAAIVLVGVIVVRRRGLDRRRSPGSLDDLLARIDAGVDLDGLPPAGAVRAAYGDALRLLATIGAGNRGAETPHEHLARVRVQLPELAAPLAVLVAHDEIARFSLHTVTGEMKAMSIAARDEVRVGVDALRYVDDGEVPMTNHDDERDDVFTTAHRGGISP